MRVIQYIVVKIVVMTLTAFAVTKLMNRYASK